MSLFYYFTRKNDLRKMERICLRGEMDITSGFEPDVGGSNPSGGTDEAVVRGEPGGSPA